MKNIMFIDPSKTSTGLFIKAEKEMSLTIECGKRSESDLFLHYYKCLSEIIDEYNIHIAIIEDYAFNYKDSRSVTVLAEIKGMVKLIMFQKNVKVLMMPIQVWKGFSKIIVNKRAKVKYVKQANEIYKKEFKSTDEVDAYLMYYSTAMILKGVVKTDSHLRYQKKIKDLIEE